MTEQPRPTGAVFLSYASQDAEAAARICEALRAAGVEVWFDRSELRGGDAWDSQIKKHVHDCALFIPVISEHTNSRIEGYFRREWNLATRRLLDMAHDAAFLVPVVIDDTRENDARVPEEFLRAQWTRLPGGDTPPAFTHRVRQLLGLDPAPVPTAKAAATGSIERSARSPGSLRPRGNATRAPVCTCHSLRCCWFWAAELFWYFQGASDAPAAKQATTTASPVATAAPNEKSIAVLPFADMSAGKDQEYFADGLSEELLNLLAKLPELRVIGRTSSFQFKGRNEDLRVIGEKLNVAHVLEGSVRKSGKKLRITAQLIRAADGSNLWSETLRPHARRHLRRAGRHCRRGGQSVEADAARRDSVTRSRPVDPEAYNLVLQGRFFVERRGQKDLERAVIYFRQARERDPDYAPAWAGLSQAYARQADNGYVPIADGYRRAREAAEKALALDPQLADAHLAMGRIQKVYDWDWAASDASVARHWTGTRQRPGPHVRQPPGADPRTLERSDRPGEQGHRARSAAAGLPTTTSALRCRPSSATRRPRPRMRKALELDPDGATRHQCSRAGPAPAGQDRRRAAGDAAGNGRSLAALRIDARLSRAWPARRVRRGASGPEEQVRGDSAYQIAEVHAFRGEADLAFEWLERAYDQRDGGITEIKSDRLMHGIVDDPRYKAFLRKLKLPE